ncbi:hypothetical protein K439DRAFT_1616246 [Ramaria rubella]|nr:hypothetical protein K439DRAFT_1616246 [Ramaria rubella]
MFSRVHSFVAAALIASSIVLATPLRNDTLSARQSFDGTATFFFQNGNPGACGQFHSDRDHIVALQTVAYDNGAHCGATITITDTNTGVTATGVVADKCPTCDGTGSIDLSQGLFEVFAPDSAGVFPGA